MPIGFRRAREVTFHVPTPPAQLITVSGGHNDEGNVAFDLFAGVDGTGYENPTQPRTVSAMFVPGPIQRWDADANGYRFLGECSLKLHTKYRPLVDDALYVSIGSVDWDFSILSEYGRDLGNDRIILALHRRRSTPSS